MDNILFTENFHVISDGKQCVIGVNTQGLVYWVRIDSKFTKKFPSEESARLWMRYNDIHVGMIKQAVVAYAWN